MKRGCRRPPRAVLPVPRPLLQLLQGLGPQADILAARSALWGPLISQKPGQASQARKAQARGWGWAGAVGGCPSVGSAHPQEEVVACSALGPPGTASPEPPSPPGSWPGPGGRAELGPGVPRHCLTCWGEALLVCPAWELLLSWGPASPPCLPGFCLSVLHHLQSSTPASDSGKLPAAPHLAADRPEAH